MCVSGCSLDNRTIKVSGERVSQNATLGLPRINMSTSGLEAMYKDEVETPQVRKNAHSSSRMHPLAKSSLHISAKKSLCSASSKIAGLAAEQL